MVEDINGPPKPEKGKSPIQGATKDASLEEMEFSMLSKINSRMNEREKKNKAKVERKELDNENTFC